MLPPVLPTPADIDSDYRSTDYVGRFAPSPTGPLHEGSLLCALASYLDAKAHKGQWLLRIEDLDPPREVPGADRLIMESLQAHGLLWDGDVLFQSDRLHAYQQALDTLQQRALVYRCICRRADLAVTGGAYPGHCRDSNNDECTPHALRLKVGNFDVTFTDGIQGCINERLCDSCGDFIIRRKDTLFSYQLAVSVDDGAQNISHVVRGIDLMESTGRQIYLLQSLGYTPPAYTHIPVLVDMNGDKLSKQTGASAIDNSQALKNLMTALQRLQQPQPPVSEQGSVQSILQYAAHHWSLPSRAAFIKL
ncbi:MAG: tRNA glutamyl-Q(34) synthetase GluQRS [Pseudomonadales bacterium]